VCLDIQSHFEIDGLCLQLMLASDRLLREGGDIGRLAQDKEKRI
jgi:hypothetical protein